MNQFKTMSVGPLIKIVGSEIFEMILNVDYDPSNISSKDAAIANSEKIVKILNDHWDDKKYSVHAADLELLDFEKWFVKTFEDIAKNQSNSEIIDTIEVSKDKAKNIIVNFSVNCGRSGIEPYNKITITPKKKVTMQLSEFLEGGDIDGNLKIAIIEKIK
jgi:hypothetical protein